MGRGGTWRGPGGGCGEVGGGSEGDVRGYRIGRKGSGDEERGVRGMG